MKKPNKGEFLANIAQGAQFESLTLPLELKKECDEVAQALLAHGVYIIAYDILGNAITEINVPRAPFSVFGDCSIVGIGA